MTIPDNLEHMLSKLEKLHQDHEKIIPSNFYMEPSIQVYYNTRGDYKFDSSFDYVRKSYPFSKNISQTIKDHITKSGDGVREIVLLTEGVSPTNKINIGYGIYGFDDNIIQVSAVIIYTQGWELTMSKMPDKPSEVMVNIKDPNWALVPSELRDGALKIYKWLQK